MTTQRDISNGVNLFLLSVIFVLFFIMYYLHTSAFQQFYAVLYTVFLAIDHPSDSCLNDQL